MNSETVPTTKHWDVIIVGTGVGGATIGRSLALKGLHVLFLERGGRTPLNEYPGDIDTAESRLARGWWPQPVTRQLSNGNRQRFYAAVGCALGGSSIHYAAALERMSASDFEGLHSPSTSTPPWPVSFTEFLPYYEAAEQLYGIKEEPHHIAERRMSEWDRALMAQMRRNGLRPEPLHVAIRYDEQCSECIGRICPRGCKADARVACLNEALRQPYCEVLEHCDVQSLQADEKNVRVVKAIYHGQQLEFRARIVVLSAGAIHTPQILLRSRNEFWPRGLANSSDQVGRNLMFHTSDVFALWAPRRLSRQARQRKAISVRDFYVYSGQRLGYVQSMGLNAGRGEIAGYIKDQLRKRGVHNELLLSFLAKAPSHVGGLVFGGAGIFAAMTEDDPNPDNRIILDPDEPDGARFTYTITDDLRRRANELRAAFAQSVKPWRMLRISTELEMNYGHPCGTCRFGEQRNKSVLDRNCLAHDLGNLYVVDASFMPRSGAINPSLTIAANAMRVAPHIVERLTQGVTVASVRPLLPPI